MLLFCIWSLSFITGKLQSFLKRYRVVDTMVMCREVSVDVLSSKALFLLKSLVTESNLLYARACSFFSHSIMFLERPLADRIKTALQTRLFFILYYFVHFWTGWAVLVLDFCFRYITSFLCCFLVQSVRCWREIWKQVFLFLSRTNAHEY